MVFFGRGRRAVSSLQLAGLVAPQHMESLFLHQGSDSCPLHWQADSLPLSHQGSPQMLPVCVQFQREDFHCFCHSFQAQLLKMSVLLPRPPVCPGRAACSLSGHHPEFTLSCSSRTGVPRTGRRKRGPSLSGERNCLGNIQSGCCSVTQLCPTLCDPVDCSTPGFPVLHQLQELAQTHVH